VTVTPDRTDRVTSYGFGVGYHFGSDMRIGLNVDQQNRVSPRDTRQYNGLRYGLSVTYGQ
jgi:hypothetical protein